MNKISYDELIIGLLLKFRSIDIIDIGLLMNMIGEDNVSSIEESNVWKYTKKNNNRIEFDLDRIKRMYESIDDFYLTMDNILSENIRNLLDNMDVSMFLLRKILMIDNYSNNNFSEFQLFVINKLYKNGNIMNIDRCIKLTKRGKLYLFMVDNKRLLDNFSKVLLENGYNNNLLDAFLIAQNLEDDINNILNLDNFLDFCYSFDINPTCDSVLKRKMTLC